MSGMKEHAHSHTHGSRGPSTCAVNATSALDCVLESIDSLLIDNIPENPSLPPLPSIPLSRKSVSHLSPHAHQQQSYNNNNDAPRQYHQQWPSQAYEAQTNRYYAQTPSFQAMSMNPHHHHYQPPAPQASSSLFPSANNNSDHYMQQPMPGMPGRGHKTYITPSSSYNSLASLGSVHSIKSSSAASHTPNATNAPYFAGGGVDDGFDDSKKPSMLLDTDGMRIETFAAPHSLRLHMKDFVFISKDCTQRLSQYIVKEQWGPDQGLLYKYLDYTFRCGAFKRHIIIVNHKYLIFHSGLQRRSDKRFLYGLLVPNKKYVTQKWRVPFGNVKNSFLTKSELLSKLPKAYLVHDFLPQRTRFHSSLCDLLYDENLSIEVNWEERLTTNKDRIYRVLGAIAFFDEAHKFLKLTDLIDAFKGALAKTKRIAELNPRVAVAQGFIDKKKCEYRIELLLPIVIEFPRGSGKHCMFALAIHKSGEDGSGNKYVVKSILTTEMAYSNARLVGYVDSKWLAYGDHVGYDRGANGGAGMAARESAASNISRDVLEFFS